MAPGSSSWMGDEGNENENENDNDNENENEKSVKSVTSDVYKKTPDEPDEPDEERVNNK